MTAHVSDHDQWVLEKDFNAQFLLIDEWPRYSCQHEIMFSITQTREFSAGSGHFIEMQDHAWILSTKAFDGSWQYRGCD